MCKTVRNFTKDKFRFMDYILNLETSLKSIETFNEQHARGIMERNQLLT
jgi:hypothetical protein